MGSRGGFKGRQRTLRSQLGWLRWHKASVSKIESVPFGLGAAENIEVVVLLLRKQAACFSDAPILCMWLGQADALCD